MSRITAARNLLQQTVRKYASGGEGSIVRSEKPVKKFTVVGNKFVPSQRYDVEGVSEEIGHTGAYFDDKDWRRNRFIAKTKHVNPNWAIDMVAEIPPIEVDGRVAHCEGRDGPDGPAALGHPKVYINLDKGTSQSCMYCGLRYIKKPHAQ